MATPINRNTGSRTPDFTAPSVPVATPGMGLTPQQTDLERFRDVMITAAGGVARAVSGRAAINSQMKRLKEQAVSRVEADLGTAARGLQSRRFERANMQRGQILAEAGERGMEWAERQFRSAMVNAGSEQESRMWESAWSGAAKQVDRTNEQAKQQSFNSAKRTMSTVTQQLNQELSQSPELRGELIGDGSAIGARVQNWMLEQLAESVDLDTMDQEAADLLIHQAVQQSFALSDSLIKVNQQQVQAGNEALATRQIDADAFAAAAGDSEPGAFARQLEITLRDRLSHLTFNQQNDYVRGVVQEQLQQIASGSTGTDAIGNLGTASDLLNIRVNGEQLFSAAERQEVATDLLNKGRATAGRLMDSEVARLREAQTQVVTLPDGSTVHRPAANPDAALVTPDPVTGVTPLEEAGNRVLLDLGLLGADNLSPEGALIVEAVRSRARGRAEVSGAAAARAIESTSNQRTVYNGLPGGNPADAHEESVQRRIMMDADALTAAGLPPVSAEETNFLRGAMVQLAGTPGSGLDIDAVRNWDGGPIEWSQDNMPLIEAVQAFEAAKWSNGATQDLYGIPKNLADEKTGLLVSDDPLKVQAFAKWATTASAGVGGAWNNYLESLDSNDRAAAVYLRTVSMRGTGSQGVRPDPQRMVGSVQAIRGAESVGTWFNRETGEVTKVGTANINEMAAVLTDVIKAGNKGVRFKGNSRDPLARGLQAQMAELFSSSSGHGRTLRDLYFAGSQANPSLDPEQIGTMVWGWMDSAGWSFREMAGKQQLVLDRQGYTGEPGDDVGEHINSNMTRAFSPYYRQFLGQALGLKDPSLIPVNLQDLWVKQSGVQLDDPWTPGALEPTYGFDDTVTNRMMRSRADYGGFEFRVRLDDGSDLGNVLSTQPAVMEWPDGTSVVVPAGTPLNVLNPDLFADSSIMQVATTAAMNPDWRETFSIDTSGLAPEAPQTVQESALKGFLQYEPATKLSTMPRDLNELASFMTLDPTTPIRPGANIGPPSIGSSSDSVFNAMADKADAAARKMFGFPTTK